MRRILRQPEPVVQEPPTPSRALRQALSRAAEQSVGLHLYALGIRQDVAPLDTLLGSLEDDLMLLALAGSAGQAGFLGLDLQARAAFVEIQTLGRVSSTVAPARRPTAADRALADPFVAAFLHELVTETSGTTLDGWVSDHRTEGYFPAAREVGLGLPDGDYRVVRMTLDLGAGGRQGLLVLCLPMPQPLVPLESIAPTQDWSAALAGNVLAARTEVRAILHRMRVPLRMAERFQLEQMVALPGVSVGNMRVETADGALVGLARLGQMGGMRAVRLADPGMQDMQDALPLSSARPTGADVDDLA